MATGIAKREGRVTMTLPSNAGPADPTPAALRFVLPVPRSLQIRVHMRADLNHAIPRLAEFAAKRKPFWLSRHPAWLQVLRYGLQHEPFLIEASADGQTRGILPLAFVHSALFGRFLVSLPYLNLGGPIAEDSETSIRLIDAA